MITVTIEANETTIQLQSKKDCLVSDLIISAGIPFAQPCAGEQRCGKCRVSVTGKLNPPTVSELRLLSPEDLQSGTRLACCCKVEGDAKIKLFTVNTAIISWTKMPDFTHTESHFGLACDIGTTTIAMQLYNRATGELCTALTEENRQRSYGADVISRIEACRTVGIHTLSSTIIHQIETMAEQCLRQANISKISETVLTGNTVMLTLFEGINPEPLATMPFTAPSLFGRFSRHKLCNEPVYLPHCIGSFIGADITCALTTIDKIKEKGISLLVDIGTNGEMVLCQDGHLFCCSTAAGPAFEGIGLHMGMPSQSGAICTVQQKNNQIVYETINQSPATGICGSGVLDTLCIMKELQILEESGYLENDFMIGDSGVCISQKDIRQIQLAKSSICAGLLTLLRHAGITVADVDHFYIAGGFGSSMNIHSAAALGLFPAALTTKAHFIGNGALGGASMLLMNQGLRKKAATFATAAEEIPLATDPFFQNAYIDCMLF